MLIVNVDVPSTGIVDGLKPLLPVTPSPVAYTVIFAVAASTLVAP